MAAKSFACPGCGKRYSVSAEELEKLAGQRFDCTICGKAFRVGKPRGPAVAHPANSVEAASAPAQSHAIVVTPPPPPPADPEPTHYAIPTLKISPQPEAALPSQHQTANAHSHSSPVNSMPTRQMAANFQRSSFSSGPVSPRSPAASSPPASPAAPPPTAPRPARVSVGVAPSVVVGDTKPRRRNAAAGVAFVFGIAGLTLALVPSMITQAYPSTTDLRPMVLFCLPIALAVFAMILGLIGLVRAADPSVKGKGIAALGILFGVLALSGHAGIYLRFVRPKIEHANLTICESNLRQIGKALQIYANDHHGQFPPKLQVLVQALDLNPDVLVCPTSGTQGRSSYVYIGQGKSAQMAGHDVIAFEPLNNHTTGSHFLYGDGDVAWKDLSEARAIIEGLKPTGK